MQDISMGWHPPSMRPQPSPVGGYSFLWSLSAVTAAATFVPRPRPTPTFAAVDESTAAKAANVPK